MAIKITDERDCLEADAAFCILRRLKGVPVVNRKIVVAELESAPHRIGDALLQGCLKGVLVGNVALHAFNRRIE